MRKLLLIICLLVTIFVSSAKAALFTPYIGVGGEYTVKSNKKKGNKYDNIKNGILANVSLGSKINFNDYVFLFGEAYYNIRNSFLELTDKDVLSSSKSTLKGELDYEFANMYGLNIGFGFNFNEKFNMKIFGIISNNKYTVEHESAGNAAAPAAIDFSTSGKKPGFGAGINLGYFVAKRVEVLLGYKFSGTKINYTVNDKSATGNSVKLNEKVLVHSANLGLAYNF